MARPKRNPTADDVDAEIRRLMDERERLVADEDRRRGALLRGYLGGPEADALRAILARQAERRDARLFGIEVSSREGNGSVAPPTRRSTSIAHPEPEPVTAP